MENIQEQVKDHELRLRRLEESDVQQRLQLANIEKSQSDIKCILNEQGKEQLKQAERQQEVFNNFTKEILQVFTNKEKTTNEIKVKDRKEIWGIVALLIGALLTYLGLK